MKKKSFIAGCFHVQWQKHLVANQYSYTQHASLEGITFISSRGRLSRDIYNSQMISQFIFMIVLGTMIVSLLVLQLYDNTHTATIIASLISLNV